MEAHFRVYACAALVTKSSALLKGLQGEFNGDSCECVVRFNRNYYSPDLFVALDDRFGFYGHWIFNDPAPNIFGAFAACPSVLH